MRTLALDAKDAVVDVILVIELRSQVGVDALGILDLAVNMVPLVAAVATNPVLSICYRGLRVEVHLVAEVTVEVLAVGIAAGLAKVVSLISTVVLRGLCPPTPVVLKIDGRKRLADFVSTLAVVFIFHEKHRIRDIDETPSARQGIRRSLDYAVLRLDVCS